MRSTPACASATRKDPSPIRPNAERTWSITYGKRGEVILIRKEKARRPRLRKDTFDETKTDWTGILSAETLGEFLLRRTEAVDAPHRRQSPRQGRLVTRDDGRFLQDPAPVGHTGHDLRLSRPIASAGQPVIGKGSYPSFT